jgi:hypothetical protein
MRNINIKIASTVLGLGLLCGLATSATAGVPSLAQNDAAKVDAPVDYVRWYWHRHHHHHIFTRLVSAGTVTYPVYRIDRYAIDYRHPIFAYAEPVAPTIAIPIISWFF